MVPSKPGLEIIRDLIAASIRDHDQLFAIAAIMQGCFCLNKNYLQDWDFGVQGSLVSSSCSGRNWGDVKKCVSVSETLEVQ